MKLVKIILAFILLFGFYNTYSFAWEEYVENVEFWSDGWVVTEWVTVEDNNVQAWDAQITDEQTIGGDTVVNQWAPTDVSPIEWDASVNMDVTTTSTTATTTSESVTMINWDSEIEVTELPTTWTEIYLVLFISLMLAWLIFYKKTA